MTDFNTMSSLLVILNDKLETKEPIESSDPIDFKEPQDYLKYERSGKNIYNIRKVLFKNRSL